MYSEIKADGNANVQAKQSQTQEYFNRLNDSIDCLCEQQLRVIDALNPVLRPEDEAEACNDDPKKCLVPLADMLDGLNDRVRTILGRYDDLLERLEL